MFDLAFIVNSAGLVIATFGGAVAFYNARKGVLWKRAELGNANIKELITNDELVFACRCSDVTKSMVARFRRWRMGDHHYAVEWGDKVYRQKSSGVTGDHAAKQRGSARRAASC